MEGWIKLHRKLIEWEWYSDKNVKALFLHCLLKANIKDKKWKGVDIKKGQFFTSISNLAFELDMTVKQIRIAMKKLENTGETASKGASNGTLITVCNYDIYQTSGQAEGQAIGQTGGKPGASQGQQLKNNKKEDNIKNYILWSEKSDNEIYKYCINYILGNNELKEPLDYLLKLDGQLTEEKFLSILEVSKKHGTKITDKLMKLEETLTNKNGKGYKDLSKTLHNWVKYNFTK